MNSKTLWATAGLVAVLAAFPARASPPVRLEVELAGGGSFSCLWTCVDSRPWLSPVLNYTGRIGVDLFDFLTPSVRVIGFNAPWNREQAWALLGEVRAHTKGVVQFNGGVALGVARADAVVSLDGVPGATGSVTRVSPYLLGDVGVRVVAAERIFVGLNVGGDPFSRELFARLGVGFIVP